ncbi:MAG: hypothetical protein ABIN89_27015 [Chitinophagaceae bacterium]
MFFDGYEQHTNESVNPALLWEFDLADFNFNDMLTLVVQRVIERGWTRDWYAILNMYSLNGVKQAIKDIPYLNEKDMHFVSLVFDIPFNEMKCFINKQSMPAHWNS